MAMNNECACHCHRDSRVKHIVPCCAGKCVECGRWFHSLKNHQCAAGQIKFRCHTCQQPSMTKPGPSDDCTEHCPPEAHLHVRCAQCSPAGWFAIVSVVEKDE